MTTFPSEPLDVARCCGCGAWTYAPLWSTTPACAHCAPLYAERAA